MPMLYALAEARFTRIVWQRTATRPATPDELRPTWPAGAVDR